MHGVTPPPFVTPTPRRIPEPYLRAEIAAFPLTSETAFRHSLLELDPKLGDGSASRALWRACEDMLAQHTGWSLDRLVAARDLGWFGTGEQRASAPLHRYLHILARSHLIARPGMTEIEQGTTLSVLDAADHYRWLTLTMPEDLLFGTLGVEPAPLMVDIDPPLLVRRLLDQGVAEIHQHMGAGMDFRLLWVSALTAIAHPYVGEFDLASPGAPLSNGRLLIRWMLAAAIARCALAEYLIRGGKQDFVQFLMSYYQTDNGTDGGANRGGAGKACKRPGHGRKGSWTSGRLETLFQTLRALSTANDDNLPTMEPLRDLYADLHPQALTLVDQPITSIEGAYQRCDPIAVRLNLRGENAGERWLLRHALRLLDVQERAGKPDKDFARLFWQTVRIRCQFYHAIVERPLTGGLQWFLRFYGRLGWLRHPIDPIRSEASYRIAGSGHRIKALELRTSIGNTAMEIATELVDLLHSWRQVLDKTPSAAFDPEFGILYHFVKGRDSVDSWMKGVPPAFWAGTFADPFKAEIDVEQGRYCGYFSAQAHKTRALAELIVAVPSSLWVIRGLDVASDEIGVPTWVLAPLFRYLIDTSSRVFVRPGAGPPLQITAHVGEDFRHLGEGLRRIYEQIHYVLDADCGRLGHAIALGVDPRTWAESVGSVLMPAEERLWDLVWEWRLYTHFRIRPEFAAEAPKGRVDCLINQIRELQNRIFGRHDYRVEELAEAHHLLHRFLLPPFVAAPSVLGGSDSFQQAAHAIRHGDHDQHVSSGKRIGRLLLRYLDEENLFQHGQTLVDVPIRGDEVEALTAIQYALRRGIAQRGIVIEVNPSSNLLIGDMLDLRNHPILNLFPPIRQEDKPPPVEIAVGSDDPVTFSTQLVREYTLLYQAGLAAGYSEHVVQEWLETIRRTGMDARFTRAWAPGAKAMTDRLIKDLSVFLHDPGFHC